MQAQTAARSAGRRGRARFRTHPWVPLCALGAALACLPESADLSSHARDWQPSGGASGAAEPGAAGGSGGLGAGSSGGAPAQGGGSSGGAGEDVVPSGGAGAGGTGGAFQSGGSGAVIADGGPPDPPPGPCQDGVLDGTESTCYLLSSAPLAWQAARTACIEWEGALVKIESSVEDAFVGDLAQVSIWIGASDTDVDNVFVWTDGSPIVFGNWGSQQPDAFPGADCIEKRLEDGHLWFDQPCDNERFYVCEKAVE